MATSTQKRTTGPSGGGAAQDIKTAAQLARERNINFFDEVYAGAVKKIDVQHRTSQKGGESISASKYTPVDLQQRPIIRILIQPEAPATLTDFISLPDQVRGIGNINFDRIEHEPVQGGVYVYRRGQNDELPFYLVLDNGCLASGHDVRFLAHKDYGDEPAIELREVAVRVKTILLMARKLYATWQYTGSLALTISMRSIEGFCVFPLDANAGRHDNSTSVMQRYSKTFETTTTELNESGTALFVRIMTDVHWALGFIDVVAQKPCMERFYSDT